MLERKQQRIEQDPVFGQAYFMGGVALVSGVMGYGIWSAYKPNPKRQMDTEIRRSNKVKNVMHYGMVIHGVDGARRAVLSNPDIMILQHGRVL